jgi:hypothetical protein
MTRKSDFFIGWSSRFGLQMTAAREAQAVIGAF